MLEIRENGAHIYCHHSQEHSDTDQSVPESDSNKAYYRVLSIELNPVLMLEWIARNSTVLTSKLAYLY